MAILGFLWASVLSFACLPFLVYSDSSNYADIPDEKWGYVTVRPHAHMFWWFYGAQVPIAERARVPLVIWLQGGPGASGTGIGNFVEIGPLDVNLKRRKATWLQAGNLLFIDSPVGTGYSYVTDESAYTTNVTGISEDLLTLFKSFFVQLPALRNTPLYIFSESYGGKVAVVFGLRLYEALRSGEIECRLDGIALGDSWISPIDYLSIWGMYLYNFNLLDLRDLNELTKLTDSGVTAIERGNFERAYYIYKNVTTMIEKLTDNVNMMNMLEHNIPDSVDIGLSASTPLSRLMNGMMKEHLSIPKSVIWGSQRGQVELYQIGDFMKDVISYVDKLLSLGVTVTIYQGQLDMECATPGTDKWMSKLRWPGLQGFMSASRKPMYLPGDLHKNTAAFYKGYCFLHMYYLLDAGHLVPKDAPEMSLQMLKSVIKLSRSKNCN